MCLNVNISSEEYHSLKEKEALYTSSAKYTYYDFKDLIAIDGNKVLKNYKKTAEKNIDTYKVVRVQPSLFDENEINYYSPYFSKKINLNDIEHTEYPISVYETRCYTFPNPIYTLVIEKGVHSWTNLNRARLSYKALKERHPLFDFIIVKSYIPKGTEYLIGNDYDIASTDLYISNEQLDTEITK